MTLEFLSDTELYYITSDQVQNEKIVLIEEEFFHAFKVMRNNPSGNLFVTDGKGKIYNTIIELVQKDKAVLKILNQQSYERELQNVSFCIPKLRNPDRLRFALEKCTELGISDFIIFDSDYSILKSDKTEKWKSYLIGAMKQSLRAYLPELKTGINIEQLIKMNGEKIVLDQKAELHFNTFRLAKDKFYFFIFGPEGGFSERESKMFEKQNIYKLSDYRLRSETAIIKCASILTF